MLARQARAVLAGHRPAVDLGRDDVLLAHREAQERIQALQARVIELLDWMDQFPFPVGIKEAAKQRKLKMGAPAVPLSEPESRNLEEFRAWFPGWLSTVLRECHP